jgi:hypothetical protein
MTIPITTRQTVVTLYRLHYPGTPAEAGRALVDHARVLGLTDRAAPLPGETLRHWATDAKPPLWAVTAAAHWLKAQAIAPADPAELAALQAVLNDQVPPMAR